MTQYSCNKCSSKNVGIETKGNQVGLYCLDCGAWIKWCNKDEVRLFSNKQHNQDNEDDNLLDKLKKIAMHYGFDSQSHMLIEEMAELTQAINKLYRVSGTYGYPTDKTLEEVANNLDEEIADVEICLEEIKYLLNNHNFVNKWKKKKIKRQLERMRKEKDK